MRPFGYVRAADAVTAFALCRERPDSAFLAGGTTEVDLVRQAVLRPGLLVDINDLPLDLIEDLPDGGLRIGALARPRVASAPRPLADGHQLVAFWSRICRRRSSSPVPPFVSFPAKQTFELSPQYRQPICRLLSAPLKSIYTPRKIRPLRAGSFASTWRPVLALRAGGLYPEPHGWPYPRPPSLAT